MCRRARSRCDREEQAVERSELAKRVDHFGAIYSQRVAYRPSEADVDAAGFFRERIAESVEEACARCDRCRQLATFPVLVLLNFGATKRLLQIRRLRLDRSHHLGPMVGG